MGRQQQGILAYRGLPGPRRGPAQHLLGTPRPENHDSNQAAFQSDGLTNRRMRARMSGGVGGDGATPSPTRFPVRLNSATGAARSGDGMCGHARRGVSVVGVTDAVGDGSSRWKTFGERTIYDNPWVWLGQVDVELPDGERFWHHVVRL